MNGSSLISISVRWNITGIYDGVRHTVAAFNQYYCLRIGSWFIAGFNHSVSLAQSGSTWCQQYHPASKTQLAKSVLDAGWYSLKTMLEYKCAHAGVVFEAINEAYSTQTCSCCGALVPSSPKGRAGLRIREWVCSECGVEHHRDQKHSCGGASPSCGRNPRPLGRGGCQIRRGFPVAGLSAPKTIFQYIKFCI